ncbi:methionine--tRNA ligase [Nocardia crassostreae]|uniref:methionine--tRNA ligase n=1 Tax=Nocardia crassostreae TaxID=53428 RepID=UPI0008364CBA|nr:methionine--tRNA ligase [Nocardia crassostreae]
MTHTYITTTIPYVNARPHLGFALELVQADVLARHHRGRGASVRFQTGTDDNSLKNVLAAERAGIGVREFVDANAAAFAALPRRLSVSVVNVLHTSRDSRHRPGVEELWRACAAAGDLYRKHYDGLYCVGCEQFYAPAELADGRCREHDAEPQRISEVNWFFRLSRYADRLRDLITSDVIRIEPAARRNEVLAFIAGGLEDFSVSRSSGRARGWGIPVPGDPDQVIYVWRDALGNYLTGLGYGTGGEGVRRWWTESDHRIHVVGKGVIRFHAVYWPAILLSARRALPTQVQVHDYLTVDGRKISKSAGTAVDPIELVDRFGVDAVRWWLLREPPRVGEVDFTIDRLVHRTDTELANGIGNLVNRTVGLVHRYRHGLVPRAGSHPPGAEGLCRVIDEVGVGVDSALADFDFRRATGAVWAIAVAANRYIHTVRPWELAAAERHGGVSAELDAVLAILVRACHAIAAALDPFLPDLAARITEQCTLRAGVLPLPRPIQPRIGGSR